MDSSDTNNIETTRVHESSAIDDALHRMATEIIAANPMIDSLVVLGILRRGRPLADRLANIIAESTGVTPPVGSLATTLYRDDLHSGVASSKMQGTTHFDFSVDGQTVLLVDDVLAAGRTIRAALDEVMDYGRPERIQLCCLLDRAGRELPIQADYLGWTIETEDADWVSVRLTEFDAEDVVLLERPCEQRDGTGG